MFRYCEPSLLNCSALYDYFVFQGIIIVDVIFVIIVVDYVIIFDINNGIDVLCWQHHPVLYVVSFRPWRCSWQACLFHHPSGAVVLHSSLFIFFLPQRLVHEDDVPNGLWHLVDFPW